MDGSPLKAGTGRLYFIDNMRTFIIMLVILTHVSMSFGPIDGWYFYDLHSKPVITYLMYYIVAVNLAFILAILFMISGYFIPGSLRKKGVSAFWKDRGIKLLIPFAAYVFVVVPVLNYFRDNYNSNSASAPVNFLTFYSENVLSLKLFGSGPMWFVFVLLVFTFGYTLYWLLFKRKPAKEQPPAAFPKVPKIIGLILILTVTTFAVRLAFPINHWFCLFGITYVDVSHLPQFLFFFVIGSMASQRKWLTAIPNSVGKAFLIVMFAAVLLWPLMMISGGILKGELESFFGGLTWQAFLYGLWEAIVSTGALIGISWLFSVKMNSGAGILPLISKESFNVYLIHAPIVVGIGYLFWGISLPTILKYIVEIILGIIICFSSLLAFKGFFGLLQKGWRLAVNLVFSRTIGS